MRKGKRQYRVHFTSKGLLSEQREIPGAAIYYYTADRMFRGTVPANDPDDAFFLVREYYILPNVRKCYVVPKSEGKW